MKSNIRKTDTELQMDVLEALRYEPSVKVTDIGVLVKDGAVTLNGYATSFGEKSGAVRAAKRVAGVTALANDIEVKLPESLRRTDGEIAAAAVDQISWSTTIPQGSVQVTVADGCVTLEGNVEWWFQKEAAENVVQSLSGVKTVANLMIIEPKLSAEGIEKGIELAFQRSALLDSKAIHVQTSTNKVTLTGKVRSYAEREEAERSAWAASGVRSVDNQLVIQSYQEAAQ